MFHLCPRNLYHLKSHLYVTAWFVYSLLFLSNLQIKTSYLNNVIGSLYMQSHPVLISWQALHERQLTLLTYPICRSPEAWAFNMGWVGVGGTVCWRATSVYRRLLTIIYHPSYWCFTIIVISCAKQTKPCHRTLIERLGRTLSWRIWYFSRAGRLAVNGQLTCPISFLLYGILWYTASNSGLLQPIPSML